MLNEHEKRKLAQRMPSQLREATVLDPPLDADGWMRVRVDGESREPRSCPWPRGLHGDVDPTPDDAAAVVESDAGNYWVVMWWPQT